MPKIPGGGMPQMKDVRIDIERDQITLMANMGGMALPMTLEAKEMKKICFRPCKIKKLFKKVDSEEVVFPWRKCRGFRCPAVRAAACLAVCRNYRRISNRKS